jgi:hypothetical protein
VMPASATVTVASSAKIKYSLVAIDKFGSFKSLSGQTFLVRASLETNC